MVISEICREQHEECLFLYDDLSNKPFLSDVRVNERHTLVVKKGTMLPEKMYISNHHESCHKYNLSGCYVAFEKQYKSDYEEIYPWLRTISSETKKFIFINPHTFLTYNYIGMSLLRTSKEKSKELCLLKGFCDS